MKNTNIVKSKLGRGFMCIVNAGVFFDVSPSVTLSKLFFSMAYPVAETVVPHRGLPTVANNEKVDHGLNLSILGVLQA